MIILQTIFSLKNNAFSDNFRSAWCTRKSSKLCGRRKHTAYNSKNLSSFGKCLLMLKHLMQRRSSRPPNPQLGGGPRRTLGAQVSLKLLFGYVTIFSSAYLFTTDLNCWKKLACDIVSECYVILSRRI